MLQILFFSLCLVGYLLRCECVANYYRANMASVSAKGRIKSALSSVKNHPIIVVIGVLGAIFGFIANVPRAWDFISDVLDLPSCVFFSRTYLYPGGKFTQEDGEWREYKTGSQMIYAKFIELRRGKKHILLENTTPREDTGHRTGKEIMLLSIPPCGGTARWTWQNPQNWEDLYQVWKKKE